ncbi:MAG: hypothetical protein KJ600_03630 [Nanoarchaeota archaeon]|nr:hypothetical protein [Nanoarchaeota archaeon]
MIENNKRYINTFQLFIAVIAIFAFIYTTSDYLLIRETPNLEKMIYGNQTTIFNYTLQEKQDLVTYNFLDNITKPILFVIFSFILLWLIYGVNSDYILKKKWIFSITNAILFSIIFFYLVPYSYLIFQVGWLNWVNTSIVLFFPKILSFLLLLFYFLILVFTLINKFENTD